MSNFVNNVYKVYEIVRGVHGEAISGFNLWQQTRFKLEITLRTRPPMELPGFKRNNGGENEAEGAKGGFKAGGRRMP